MCEWGNTEVFIRPDGKIIDVDSCILPLVEALNGGGYETVASCCGHGNRYGNIALADGREFLICSDYDAARELDKMMVDIHGNRIDSIS
ncbi:hypothetical protein KAR91_13350 [Candidatus Pacearchaeota archaeon]|nr:hypothetical protein [Candidatus Pacearchaeota archaeon]